MEVPGFLELCLHSIFEMTKHFPDEKVFDLLMHVSFRNEINAKIMELMFQCVYV